MARPGVRSDGEFATLWQQFHDAVNMTSRELQDWLQTEAAHEGSEELPDQAGHELGRRVLAILGKRRTDLTDDDVAVMRRVLERITRLRGDETARAERADRWRRQLMDLGHDPLKPSA
jgi:ribosomal 50S subunit-associated protein YjgA (DUF615 family)